MFFFKKKDKGKEEYNKRDPNESEINEFNEFYGEIKRQLKELDEEYLNLKDILIGKIKRKEKTGNSFERLFKVHLKIKILGYVMKDLDAIKKQIKSPDFYSVWITKKAEIKELSESDSISLDFEKSEREELKRRFHIMEEVEQDELHVEAEFNQCEDEFKTINDDLDMDSFVVVEKYKKLKNKYEQILPKFEIIDLEKSSLIKERIGEIDNFVKLIKNRSEKVEEGQVSTTESNKDYKSLIENADNCFESSKKFAQNNEKSKTMEYLNKSITYYKEAIDIIQNNEELRDNAEIKSLVGLIEHRIEECYRILK